MINDIKIKAISTSLAKMLAFEYIKLIHSMDKK